jgi:hypothetical protein
MDILTNAVPQWVSILFLAAILVPVFMIANVARQGAINANLEKEKARNIYRAILLFYGLYFSYVSLTCFTGFFKENTLPPKILFYTAFPMLVFFLLVISNLKIYKTILQHVTLQSLVGVHLFRLIGVFFLITNAYGAIPAKFAYIAGIGDIATALTSILVVKAITNKKNYAKPLTIVWNIFGILDIVSVLVTAISSTKLSIETGTQGISEIANFPFCLIPAFAPATIIFLHISIFRKLWNDRITNQSAII